MFMDTLTATKREEVFQHVYLLCEHWKNKFTVEGSRLSRKSECTSQVGNVDSNNLSQSAQRPYQERQFAFHLKKQILVASGDCRMLPVCRRVSRPAAPVDLQLLGVRPPWAHTELDLWRAPQAGCVLPPE